MSKWIRIMAIFMTACILCGCSSSDRKATSRESGQLTDAMQRQVTIPTSVKRIVSVAPSVTEILFAIGLDEEIVGVTDFCDYPDAAREKPSVGGYHIPNVEAILSLTPDIVIATPDGYSRDKVKKLESVVPIFLIDPEGIDEMLEAVLTLGRITGRDDAAKQIVASLRMRVEAVKKKVALIPAEERPKVFYEIGRDPLITAGPGNFVDNLITAAGGINIASDAPTDWPRYSVEAVIMKEPDVILTAPHTASAGSLAETWRKYKTIPAVQNGRIYSVDPDILLRPGPRMVDGLERLHSLFADH